MVILEKVFILLVENNFEIYVIKPIVVVKLVVMLWAWTFLTVLVVYDSVSVGTIVVLLLIEMDS